MGFNSQIPGTRKPCNKAKKETYQLTKDKKIINSHGEEVGTYAHRGSPDPGERSCKVKREWVSYLPFGESAAP